MASRGRGGRLPRRPTRLHPQIDDPSQDSSPRGNGSTPQSENPATHLDAPSEHQDPPAQNQTQDSRRGHQSSASPQSQDDVLVVTKPPTRGPTMASVETTRQPSDPPMKVLLYNGNAVGENEHAFKNTVLGWIKKPVKLRQDVKRFKDIPFDQRWTLFNRINETFEITVVNDPIEDRPMTPGASSSTHQSFTSESSSRSATAPTIYRGDRVDPKDPANCLPLSIEHCLVIEMWVRASFREYRHDICKKYYDKYSTDKERLEHVPPGWPEDQWKWIVEYWGTEEFKKKRELGKRNIAKAPRHTGGSKPFQSIRYDTMLKTRRPIDEIEFFRKVRTTKTNNTFVDDESRQASEMMDDRALELMDEEGKLTVPSKQIVHEVIGSGKKGREPLQGRVLPKKTKVTTDDINRVRQESAAEVERVRQEASREVENVSKRFEEQLQSMQSQFNQSIQQSIREAMMSEGQLQSIQSQVNQSIQQAVRVTMMNMGYRNRQNTSQVPFNSRSQEHDDDLVDEDDDIDYI